MSAIELTGIQYAYRRTAALRGVSLTVAPGETVAVTGRSGSGKSTLLHVASGIAVPQAGRAVLLGQDLADLSESDRTRLRRRSVGIVLQFGQLVPDLTVVDNVALPLLLEGTPRAAARIAAQDLLARVGMPELYAARPGQLSGGQAQRVAVARALVTGPSVVFADEPTGSTDTVSGETLLDLLFGAVRDQGAALLIVTHDNTVAARADREVRLRDGAVEYEVVVT